MLVSVLCVHLAVCDLVEIPDHLARHMWATPLTPAETPCHILHSHPLTQGSKAESPSEQMLFQNYSG